MTYAVPDLGFAPVDGRPLRAAGRRRRRCLWGYGRAARRSVRIAAALEGVGFTALAISLLEPLLTGPPPAGRTRSWSWRTTARACTSDDGHHGTRGDGSATCSDRTPWKTRLGQDFDVRGYVFDSHLRAVEGFDDLTFDGTGTALRPRSTALARRFRGLPLAGVLLFTDGNRTDLGDLDWSQLPPIYPVSAPLAR